jgi:hypothetical protein
MAKQAKSGGPKVMALNVRTKKSEEMLDPKPVYSLTTKGNKRFRLTGKSKDGVSMSKLVKEDVAKLYGTPKKVEVKPRAARKPKVKTTCEKRYVMCVDKLPGSSRGSHSEELYGIVAHALDELAPKKKAAATKPKKEGAAKPKKEGAAKPKKEGAAKPKKEGAAKPKKEGAAKPKKEGAAKPKKEGAAKPKKEGAAKPKKEGAAKRGRPAKPKA